MKKYIASVSFGKDSLAMLLKILDTEIYKIDEVVFYDTGMEFKTIYEIRDKIKRILSEKNIKYTEFKPLRPFLFDMLEKTVKHKDGTITHNGYSWCGGKCRWGTSRKTNVIDKYCKKKGAVQLVGIAADEPKRIKNNPDKIYPLVELGMTEKDCLNYCYEKGYFWIENGIKLYDILDRVSCWCCANKNLKELQNYYNFLPEYWLKLKDLQSKTKRPFYKNKISIFDLEKKYGGENE